jgi:hypothetical protein
MAIAIPESQGTCSRTWCMILQSLMYAITSDACSPFNILHLIIRLTNVRLQALDLKTYTVHKTQDKLKIPTKKRRRLLRILWLSQSSFGSLPFVWSHPLTTSYFYSIVSRQKPAGRKIRKPRKCESFGLFRWKACSIHLEPSKGLSHQMVEVLTRIFVFGNWGIAEQ